MFVAMARVSRWQMFFFAAIVGCAPNRARIQKDPYVVRGNWYTVTSEDTLEGLAQRYAVSLEDLQTINGIDRAQSLTTGQKLFVPQRRLNPASALRFQLVWPVEHGTLSAGFGTRSTTEKSADHHDGIDIRAPAGTPVKAAADGVVMYAGDGLRGYGNLVILRHVNHWLTLYAHQQRLSVREKDVVTAGQVIGTVGNTGRSSGFHLHFELRRGETPIDPVPHFTERIP